MLFIVFSLFTACVFKIMFRGIWQSVIFHFYAFFFFPPPQSATVFKPLIITKELKV